MNSFRQILNKCSPLLPMLVSIIAFFIENPYLGLIYSIVTVILVTFILERLSRKQLFNVFLFEVPNVSASFLETQYRLLEQPITRILNPVTTIIISIYIYRCRRLRPVGPPKKLEPSRPLKITLTLRCPKCGTELLTDAEFCQQCGTKLPPHPISK
ncbi:zinc-ribbon domain-containing protein [Candidatus Bathyarchaeota archaeon]|nr:zinc-ribbon domain-containing protein [Candidatus Bathyarchaeota archaeon]